eukprot:8408867-Pyramimonas_sp.AAC.1
MREASRIQDCKQQALGLAEPPENPDIAKPMIEDAAGPAGAEVQSEPAGEPTPPESSPTTPSTISDIEPPVFKQMRSTSQAAPTPASFTGNPSRRCRMHSKAEVAYRQPPAERHAQRTGPCTAGLPTNPENEGGTDEDL